jgi:hypothetical protein
MTEKEAGQLAHRLVQRFIGPDRRVADMQSFFRALSQALQEAHTQGWKDRAEAEKILKH